MKKLLRRGQRYLGDGVVDISRRLRANDWILARRMFKYSLAMIACVIVGIIPAVTRVYGKATYLLVIVAVFGHPGRRLGQMVESVIMAVSGCATAMGWVCLGVYLSSLVYASNAAAAYTIKGIFLAIAMFVHGYVRASFPRLFLMIVLFMVINIVGLTGLATSVTPKLVTTIMYPVLTAVPILLLINMFIFPELSSSFLGKTTITTLQDTVDAMRDAGKYFVTLPDDAKTNNEPQPENADPQPDEKPSKGFFVWLRSVFNDKAESPSVPPTLRLAALTAKKAQLRGKLVSLKSAQQECNFEVAFSVLPPRDVKPISTTEMKKTVASTIALIGACESKYALMGDIGGSKERKPPDQSKPPESTPQKKVAKKTKKKKSSHSRRQLGLRNVGLVKAKKEIEFADVNILTHIIERVRTPIAKLQAQIDCAVHVISCSLAYCYDVSKLPSGVRPPSGLRLDEIDIHLQTLSKSLKEFDQNSAAAFEDAAVLHEVDGQGVDMLLRMEAFLICSFLLNLRQGATHIQGMLQHCRILVEKRQARKGRRRFYLPRISWRKWLTSGGELDKQVLPANARKQARTGEETSLEDEMADDLDTVDSNTSVPGGFGFLGSRRAAAHDEESQRPSRPVSIFSDDERLARHEQLTLREKVFAYKARNKLADFIDHVKTSEDILFAFKLTLASMLLAWPAFVAPWNTWYYLHRGLWAIIQMVLVTEVAIGTSLWALFIRTIGTVLGCLWGWAAVEARNGNKEVVVAMLGIGIVVTSYIQLGTAQVKAGIVLAVSMCIVAMASVVQTVPGPATETFLKRLIAFLIGGSTAIVMEVLVFPIRARDRLSESMAAAIRHIMEMEGCLAYGAESGRNTNPNTPALTARFELAKTKAEAGLTAAAAFLPACSQEPRLKGSFKILEPIYGEILFVLHQMVDRMDNMLALRKQFGSGVIETINPQVHPYRRNVAGAINLVLFAIHEGLTTKLPLPQFMPSARLAHLRLVNRVREVMLSVDEVDLQTLAKLAASPLATMDLTPALSSDDEKVDEARAAEIELVVLRRIVRQKFLAWSALSAGQIEVIEYLEELTDLAKLLVGANEFRSGMLMRPTYREYVAKIGRRSVNASRPQTASTVDELPGPAGRKVAQMAEPVRLGLNKRRVLPTEETATDDETKDLPQSLQSIRTRRAEQLETAKQKEE